MADKIQSLSRENSHKIIRAGPPALISLGEQRRNYGKKENYQKENCKEKERYDNITKRIKKQGETK